jgi:hypothetical protein
MHIQLNTDNHIAASPALSEKVEKILRQGLKHLTDEITRIEVHLNDENGVKSGSNDKRCLLEARVPGMPPVSVEHRADTVALAAGGATEQLARALKSALDKARGNSKQHESIKYLDQGENSDL